MEHCERCGRSLSDTAALMMIYEPKHGWPTLIWWCIRCCGEARYTMAGDGISPAAWTEYV